MASHKRKARLAAEAALRDERIALRAQAAAELAKLLDSCARRLEAGPFSHDLLYRLHQELTAYAEGRGPGSAVALGNYWADAVQALKKSDWRNMVATCRHLAQQAAAWNSDVEAQASTGVGYAFGHPFHSDPGDEI